MTRCAVLGSPIAHSRSPVLHRAAYEALGLTDWRYDAFEVTQETLGDFVAGLTPTWRGLSLTMPLKQAVIGLLDEVTPQALLLQSVNTVIIDRSAGRPRLSGSNTDVLGIECALREIMTDAPVQRGCVLGAGATAASALAGLARLGVNEVAVAARRPTVACDHLGTLAEPLGLRLTFHPLDEAVPLLQDAQVVVSTVPAGGADAVAQTLHTRGVAVHGVLLDVVYHPWPTPLAATWGRLGGVVTDGAQMLLHQAVAQVEMMTGVSPGPVAAMRRALNA